VNAQALTPRGLGTNNFIGLTDRADVTVLWPATVSTVNWA
jgi:hypothetical protein